MGMKKIDTPVYVTKPFLPPIEAYITLLREIWDCNVLTNNGPFHQRLEEALKTYLGVANSVLFTNGHLALESVLRAMNLRGEVITTPFTFASTTHAIVNNGLKPVFCDINPYQFTLDASKIEALITDKTCAILPVHVFGYPCDVEAIETLAKQYGLKVIYDAAHAFGVKIKGVGIGNYGDAAMFSMHATKVYNTIEGGSITFGDNQLKEELNNIKNFGITGPETVCRVGINAKMNEFQAAMGLLNLQYLDEQIKKRKLIAEGYRNVLKDIPGIYYLEDQKDITHNYAYFPILIDETQLGMTRDALHEALKAYNIFTRKYFYPLVTAFECYKPFFQDAVLPCAETIANRVLTLPIYGDLTPEFTIYMGESIKDIIKKV